VQLAIDTSTDFASLALVQGSEILAEFTWRCGLNHTVELYPRLNLLLEKSATDIRTADCIFVAKGPGSFNGLRVGVSAAKGLAFSLGIPIIGISTLEIMAYQQAAAGMQVCAISNAGRQEVAAAIFRHKRNKWTQVAEEHITTIEGLVPKIKEKTIFCGEINAAALACIKKLFKTRSVIPSQAARLRRSTFLAELGQQRIEAGTYDNLAALQPLYLRRPPITERRKPF
jgi:tRNA threonylcarbamoyl adenosine modification protein YeaZ